jgi:hypothetical protein
MLQAFSGIFGLSLVLVSTAASANLDLEPWMTERRIIGENNLEPAEKAAGSPIYDTIQAVARVEVMDGYGFCTGAQVGESLFLTNYHCDLGCETTVFRLGYENDVPAKDRTGYRCVKMLRKNELLDYALYAVEPLPEQVGAKMYPILPLSRSPATQSMRAVLASHPTGRTKVIDRSADCVISDPNIEHTDSGRDTMKHTCDTEGGSSGAPVIDYDRGVAVGLHWGGRGNDFNYAIPMPRIIEDLETHLDPEMFSRLHVID